MGAMAVLLVVAIPLILGLFTVGMEHLESAVVD